MTKPFPCCCGCIHCLQYDLVTDVWTYLLSGMTAGSVIFTSSTTGNALFTDLNALGTKNFTFGLVTTLGGGVIEAITGLLSPFPGKTWNYSGSTISSITIELLVRDHCSKVWLSGVAIKATAGLGITTLARFDGATEPGSPNCGSNLTQAQSSAANSFLGTGGSITLDPP